MDPVTAAARRGVQPRSIWELERGVMPPPLARLYDIINALDLDDTATW
ncbi:hypothetical protein [Singulisphaera sp. GP187]|nr:hypothetical protein [Singulisphaera sp. GP187]